MYLSSTGMAAEHRLTGPEIQTFLQDHSFTGTDAGHAVQQSFQNSGATFYSVDGNQSQGLWQVRGDQYCSQWPPHEGWACYGVSADEKTVTFISSDGTRYPMKRQD